MYRRRKVVTHYQPEIPTTLDGFGYIIKEDGSIRDKEKDLIGDVVEKKLQAAPFNFQKVIVPLGADPSKNDPHSYIFMTPNALTTTSKLVVFIPGTHTRIGQWSRRIMCDENIYNGSMMQMTTLFMEKGYEVIILNPNANFWYKNKAWEKCERHTSVAVYVPENGTPEEHCQYVFHNIIRNAKAENVAIMGLGWGGNGIVSALNDDFDYMKKHVQYISIMSSNHGQMDIKGDAQKVWFRNHCVNWVLSTDEKKKLMIDDRFGCTCYSTGVDTADFIFTQCLDEIMEDVFVNMKDIELKEEQDDDEAYSKEEEAELSEHLKVISIN
ncbi:Arb2 domain-containing protein [Pilobolus umbonatus]|nr:Arb2 domain-containing protein [Pilobolus umbonatus]